MRGIISTFSRPHMTQISRRAAALGTENAFVVLAEVNALARQGKDISSFCIGQPDFPAPEHVQEAAIRAIKGGKHGYTPSAGIDELREAAARYLAGRRGGLPIRPEDVVIYANPGFPIYESQIVANGAKPVPINLHEAKNFAFDLDDLEKLITKRTRLLILNYPHNPTGGSLSRAELQQIGRLLEKHPQVWVYADEIYSRLVFGEEFFSIAQVPGMYERTIISDGASKTWAMTGWRIGFTSNPTLAPVFTRWITNTESCASQISQWAALEAINGPQDAAEMMKRSFLERRDLITKLLNEVPGVTCLVPDGAFYAWPNVTEACRRIGAADSEEFRKRLLNEAGVAVLADIHFGSRVPGEGQHVRFSYAASKQAIEAGVARMADFIRKNTRKAA